MSERYVAIQSQCGRRGVWDKETGLVAPFETSVVEAAAELNAGEARQGRYAWANRYLSGKLLDGHRLIAPDRQATLSRLEAARNTLLANQAAIEAHCGHEAITALFEALHKVVGEMKS